MSQGKIYLTTHVKERFLQRTNKKYKHLQNCKLGETKCEDCRNLMADIRFEIRNKYKDVENEIHEVIKNAQEERSYLNNHGFMDWYYQKYGYDKRFKFLVEPNCNLLFVVLIERGKEVAVTCVKAKTHMVGKAMVSRNKFRKKPV